MPFSVYIFQSQSTGRYYCGYTIDLERRLRQYNNPDYRANATTRRFQSPWKQAWIGVHPSSSAAMLRECHIKKRGIKRFLEE